MSVDVVERVPRPVSTRRWWTVAAVVLALAAVLAAAAWVDRERRRDEAVALAACDARARAAVDRVDRRLAVMADYIAPALVTVPPSRRDGFYDLMERAAEDARPALPPALDACSSVGVDRWHADHLARRAAYVDYLHALAARLDAVAADGGTHYRDDPGLTELRDAALGS